ncbi:hypothetical protein GCM10023346_45620 [Arthrobacter gyeryongensis]|uniref:Uncharacterized protein n=1 Tax=Arthrobacter gyeryongensis TaxID=1650592 RepID=A0ABP9SSD2_9MICC
MLKARQHPVDIVRVVLSVGVNLNGARVSVTQRIVEAGPHRAANPQIKGKNDDGGPGLCRDTCSFVLGSIVDYEDVVMGYCFTHLTNSRTNCFSFIPGRHDNQRV